MTDSLHHADEQTQLRHTPPRSKAVIGPLRAVDHNPEPHGLILVKAAFCM
jgi:hypothetical protein